MSHLSIRYPHRPTKAQKRQRLIFKSVGLALILGCMCALGAVAQYKNNLESKSNDSPFETKEAFTTPKSKALSVLFSVFTSGSGSGSDSSSSGGNNDYCPVPKNATVEEQCDFVKDNCDEESIISYLQFRYCVLGKHGTAAIVFGIILLCVWLIILFYILGEAAEAHFCPMLSEISAVLKLSPDLAGMTILAFGNGAPDVFSSLAAFGQGNISILIGAMLGAGAFITHLIVGAVGIVAKTKLGVYPFIRDCACYILGLLFVLALMIDHELRLWEAIGFLVFYVIYIGVAVGVHIYQVKHGKAHVVTKGKKEGEEGEEEKKPLLDGEEESKTTEKPSTEQVDDKQKSAKSMHDVTQFGDEDSNDKGSSTTAESKALPSSGRNRSYSIHVDTVVVADKTAGETKTDKTPDHQSTPGEETRKRSNSSCRAPVTYNADAVLASLSGKSPLARKQEEEEDDDDDSEVEELTLVSGGSEFSIQNGDKEGQKSDSSRTIAPAKPKKEKKDKKDAMKNLGVLGLLGQGTSGLVGDSMVIFFPDSNRKRFDGYDEIKERQRHMLRGGLMNIVEGWKNNDIDVEAAVEAHKRRLERQSQSGCMALLEQYKDHVEWDEMGIVGKIFHIVSLPLILAMDGSVPHPEEEAYNKWVFAIATAFSPVPVFLGFQLFDIFVGPIPLIALCVAITVIIGIFIAIFAPKDKLPKALLYIFVVIAFVTSMMWIYAIANEAIALLQDLSSMFGLSDTIMGLTVLSWGNSVGDFVADITVANQGYPEMAIAATYGGPLFNLLIGMGLGGTIQCIKDGNIATKLDSMMLIGFIYLLVALAASLVVIPFNKFVVDKKIGLFLLCGYVIFMTLSFLVEFKVLTIVN